MLSPAVASFPGSYSRSLGGVFTFVLAAVIVIGSVIGVVGWSRLWLRLVRGAQSVGENSFVSISLEGFLHRCFCTFFCKDFVSLLL